MRALLGLRDTIRGTAKLNWTAGKPMSEWMGVTVSGTPQRVTALNLADFGLDGELSGLLGELTGLTTINLNGNALTGMLPSKLGQLTSLTTVSLDGAFEGCAPAALATASGLDICGPPTNWHRVTDESDRPLPAGTYRIGRRDRSSLIFDWPDDAGLVLKDEALVSPPEEGERRPHGSYGIIYMNVEETVRFVIDVNRAGEWPRLFDSAFTHVGTESGYTQAEYNAIFDRIVESMWEQD